MVRVSKSKAKPVKGNAAALAGLKSLRACPASVEWAKSSRRASIESAWQACPRADWLIWYAARTVSPMFPMVAAVAACVRWALPPEHRYFPLINRAASLAEMWAEGKVVGIYAEKRACEDELLGEAFRCARRLNSGAVTGDMAQDADLTTAAFWLLTGSVNLRSWREHGPAVVERAVFSFGPAHAPFRHLEAADIIRRFIRCPTGKQGAAECR